VAVAAPAVAAATAAAVVAVRVAVVAEAAAATDPGGSRQEAVARKPTAFLVSASGAGTRLAAAA
jgi:hypothetical protein